MFVQVKGGAPTQGRCHGAQNLWAMPEGPADARRPSALLWVLVAVAAIAPHADILPWPLARGGLVLVAVAAWAAVAVRGLSRRELPLRLPALGWLALAWLAARALAAALALDRHLAAHHLIWDGLAVGLLLAMVTSGGRSFRRLLLCLVLSAAAASVAGMAMWALGVTLSGVTYTMRDQNVLAAYLLLLAAPAAGLAASAETNRERIAAWVGAAALAGGILATGSRGGIAGLLISGALLWACVGSRYAVTRKARTAAIPLLAVIVLAGPIIKAVFAPPVVSSSMPHRLFMWNTSIRMAVAEPLSGAGPGNFRLGYLSHRPPRERSSYALAIPGDGHSDMMDAVAEGGLPGFGLTVALVVFVLGRARARAVGRGESPPDWLAAGLFAGIAGWVANGLLNSSFLNPAVQPTAFALLALAYGSGAQPSEAGEPRKLPRWLLATIGLFVLSCAAQRIIRTAIAYVLVTSVALPPQFASLLRGGEAPPMATPTRAASDDLDRLALASRIDPSYNVPYQTVAALTADTEPGIAEAALKRSIELVPAYAGSHNALGRLLLRQGRGEEAVGHLSEAVRLDHYNGYYRLDLARALKGRDRYGALRQLSVAAFYLSLAEEIARDRYGDGSPEAEALARIQTSIVQERREVMGR